MEQKTCQCVWRGPLGVVAYVLDCEIVVSIQFLTRLERYSQRKNALRLRRNHSGLYLQLQNSIDLFIEDISHHKPLFTIYGPKKVLPAHMVNMLQRWGTIIQKYIFKMDFFSSEKLNHADGLSRLIPTYKNNH